MSVRSAVPGIIPRRVIHVTAALAAIALMGLTAAMADAAVINDPPPAGRSLVAFPARDFVSGDGYLDDHAYRVEVEHPASLGGGIIVSQRRLSPTGGVLEVNHPGGGCWAGSTPDIRPGDIVRVIDEDTGEVDQTTVANVTAKRPVQTGPGSVEIHGTAMTADGAPMPLDALEQRLVAPGEQFAKSRRRDLRAIAAPGENGRLAYDADGSTNWTATYTDLTAADVDLALGAESIGLWLGRDPAAGTEGTNYEVGAGITGGPQAPCTAPKEVLPPPLGSETEPPSVPSNVKAVVSGTNTVTLTWDASTDNVGVVSYGIYRNGQPLFDVQNPDGSPSPRTTFTDANLPPGTYTYSVDAADEIGNRSAQQSSDPVTAAPNPAPAVPVNEPPANGKAFTAFPSRDFAEVDGFAPGETGTVQVIRDGKVISSADDVIPTPDGVIEVNHPGGVCWNGTTPELRAGDVVRAITYGPNGDVLAIDQITVANVTAQKAVQTSADTVQIHGTAQGHDGKPLPLGEIEQRLVSSSRDPFDKNGRRTLRAPEDGTLAYDKADNPTGVNWTATYTGLSAADVQRALAVESRVMWLGRDPLAGVELTIFEAGTADPPGPSAGFCSSPLEPADVTPPSAPTLTAIQSGTKDVKLDWTAATDDHYVYGYRVFKDGQPLRNLGRDARSFLDVGVAPGTHTYAVAAFDSASPRGDGPTIIEQLQSGLGKPYGNLGPQSAAKSLTLLDVTAPAEPANLTAKVNVPTVGKPTVDLAWNASTDDVGVTNYLVFRRPVQTPAANYTRIARLGATTSYKDAGVTLSGAYEYTVEAQDAAGNQSTRAPRVAVTIAFDDVAPTAPTGVSALNWPDVHAKDVRITWDAATDNVGVSRYGIYRDGSLLEEVSAATALSYRDDNRPAGTYEYTVDAVDSTGNRSPRSALDRVIVANDPPQAGRDVTVFPSRDFVSASGYPAGVYQFDVLRGRKVVSRSTNIAAVAGVVEVNHGGQPGLLDRQHAGHQCRRRRADRGSGRRGRADHDGRRELGPPGPDRGRHRGDPRHRRRRSGQPDPAQPARAAARVRRGELRQERAQLAADAGRRHGQL